jgi:preprotein translocase subunit SecE
MRNRAQRTAAALSTSGGATPTGTAPAEPKKPGVSPAQFVKEVRAETRKITWTSWKETWITSVMVAIMVLMAALFFYVVDTGWRVAINFILKLATGG